MISKILKFELVALFFLTVLSFISFYYYASLPDNTFFISSVEEEVTFFSYYFSSLVTTVGFFFGPWVFFSFATFGIFYSFVYSKRSFLLDEFIFIVLAIVFLGFSNYFYPIFLGDGIAHLIKLYIGSTNLLILSSILVITFFVLTYRMSFFYFLKSSYFFAAKAGPVLKLTYRKIRNAIVKTKWFIVKVYKKLSNIFSKSKNSKPENTYYSSQGQFENKTQPNETLKSEIASDRNIREVVITEESHGLAPQSSNEVEQMNLESPTIGAPPRYKPKKIATKIEHKELMKCVAEENHNKHIHHPDEEYFSKIIDLVESKLAEFNVGGKIVNVLKGPVVDTYELELDPGVKVSKVLNMHKDLTLALSGAPIRIEQTMKGRPTIGIEVPRSPRDFIYLDELLGSKEFANSKFSLPIAVGKNAFGEIFISDLSKMPHMLVAGETGAGKSVFLHSLIVSLLVKKSPDQMKFIMIDPKQLEMVPYVNLPHLVMPVINKAKEASFALMWACQEMDKRYSILKEFGVRNIDGFNSALKDATPSMIAKIHHLYEDDSGNYELPYIVIVIDEFADLMHSQAGKDIETSIARLAAVARASGIHLVLTTQRPSTDVVTGLIKSNFPTRVALKVASPHDSRTILDTSGAENLLSHGDMLYKKGVDLIRVHSPFISEKSIDTLVEKLSSIENTFNEKAMEFLENEGNIAGDSESYGSMMVGSNNDKDEYYNPAVNFIMEKKKASASMLQRKFGIGYNRAANLIELMEENGIVGPARGSKPREIFGMD